MKTHLIHIVLVVSAHLTALSQGTNPSVSLTVEGGRSLVGEQCPGAVKVLCYGVDLSVIRWRFNGNTDVITFFSDNVAPSPFTNNPAFLNAELLSATQDPVDPNFANFSSELVVDVSKLQTESIYSIACGDPDTFKMIPVDVEIIQQTEPESPNVTNVIALYEDGSLTDVLVSLEKLETRCQDFQSSLVYQVALLGSSMVAVNHTSCGEVCIVNFQNFVDPSKEYRVSLFAVNDIGTSEVMEYPTSIVKQSSFYFTPTFLSNDCLFICECLSNGSLDTDSCNVLYTTDSMYRDPSPIIFSPLNTQFEITGITSDTVYYFEFSVSVNHTLLVRNRLIEQAMSSPRLSVLVIVLLALTILAILFGAVFGTVICFLKKLNRFPANVLFIGAWISGTVSFISLIVFSVITGAQEDTCSLDWSRARDALIIVALLLAFFGNVCLVCFLLASRRKKEFSPPRHSQDNMHRSGPANSPTSSQLTNQRVTENTQEPIELNNLSQTSSEKSALGSPKEGEDSKPGDSDVSSGQKDATTESSLESTGHINTTSEDNKLRVPSLPGEEKYLQSSQTKQGESYTVYKVVVRLENRSYFLFRRYSEFEKLLNKIKQICPYNAEKLKLPGRFRIVSNFNADFIKGRRVGLNNFVINLMKIPDILKFPPVRVFLAIDDPRLGLPIYDYETIDEPADEGIMTNTNRVKLGEKEDTTAKITDFDLLKVIGKGTFPVADLRGGSKSVTMLLKKKVYLGRYNKTGGFYAIKVLQKEAIVKCSKVKHIMAKRNNTAHPFLVGLHFSFQTSTNLYFVLDYVNGGTLFFHLQKEKVFDEHRARFYAAEITLALGYLHNLKIIYWDLKIENILLDFNGHVKLTDFGLCEEKLKFGDKSHKTTMICGTPDCPAPEVLLSQQEYTYSVDSNGHVILMDFGLCKEKLKFGDKSHKITMICDTPDCPAPEVLLSKQEYSYSVDWWCLGIVTYEMMYGQPPFYSTDVAQMRNNILHKPLQLQPHITASAQNLLKALLEKDKDNRLGSGTGDDEDIKAHPFFELIKWDDLCNSYRLQPPFDPREKDALDLKQFDCEFTAKGISDTPSLSINSGTTGVPSVRIADNTFNVN